MHHNAVNNAAIASSKQWLLPNIAHAIWKTILSNLNYVQCLNIAPKEKIFKMEYIFKIFAKVDLLTIDNDSGKKKIAKRWKLV